MDYLLASSLSSYEIILGKWFGKFLQIVMILVSFIGVVSIIRMTGGVEILQLVVLFVSGVALLFSLSALSIFISTCNRQTRLAIFRAAMAALVFGIVGFFVGIFHMMIERGGRVWFSQWFVPFVDVACDVEENIGTFKQIERLIRYQQVGDTWHYLLYPTIIYVSFHVTVGVLLLWWSARMLRKVHLERAMVQKKRDRLRPARHAWESFPIAWREWYFSGIGSASRLIQGAMLTFIIFFLNLPLMFYAWDQFFSKKAMHPSHLTLGFQICIMAGYMLILLLTAVRSATSVSFERDRDTWLSLISTPVLARQLVLGKFIGSLKHTLIGLLVGGCSLSIGCYFGAIRWVSIFCVLAVIMSGAFLVAAIGTSHSFRFKNASTSLSATLFAGVLCCGPLQLLIWGLFELSIVTFMMPRPIESINDHNQMVAMKWNVYQTNCVYRGAILELLCSPSLLEHAVFLSPRGVDRNPVSASISPHGTFLIGAISVACHFALAGLILAGAIYRFRERIDDERQKKKPSKLAMMHQPVRPSKPKPAVV